MLFWYVMSFPLIVLFLLETLVSRTCAFRSSCCVGSWLENGFDANTCPKNLHVHPRGEAGWASSISIAPKGRDWCGWLETLSERMDREVFETAWKLRLWGASRLKSKCTRDQNHAIVPSTTRINYCILWILNDQTLNLRKSFQTHTLTHPTRDSCLKGKDSHIRTHKRSIGVFGGWVSTKAQLQQVRWTNQHCHCGFTNAKVSKDQPIQ